MEGVNSLTVVIVEDDPLISSLLESDLTLAGHTVKHVFHSGDMVIDYIKENIPDLVCLDINLGGKIDGIDLGAIIQKRFNIPFIYLTAYSDRATLLRAKVTNPCAYIVKPYKTVDLFAALEIGLANFQNRKKEISKVQLDALASDPLSEREFDIMRDLSDGMTNGQIASNQNLSENTIKWHMQNIYSKFDVRNRTALAKIIFDSMR